MTLKIWALWIRIDLNDARIGCKVLYNLVKLIKFEIHLEQKLDELEGSFEQNELKEN
jgi:hypothetical protein